MKEKLEPRTDDQIVEELKGRLFGYLGGMNMLGVMEGKTTDGAIRQRDKAVDDIVELVLTAFAAVRVEAGREAALKELQILETHLNRQIVESTISTLSLYGYIDARINALTPSNQDV